MNVDRIYLDGDQYALATSFGGRMYRYEQRFEVGEGVIAPAFVVWAADESHAPINRPGQRKTKNRKPTAPEPIDVVVIGADDPVMSEEEFIRRVEEWISANAPEEIESAPVA